MMTRTVPAVRQYLAAAFLIIIGLMASGCGDSATVNPVAELASLGVDPGTLQPAFSGGTTQYTVDLSNNITSVTITAQPAVSGDTVTINGQQTTSSVIPLGAAGTTTPVSIVVSESGTNSRTYTVLLVRAGLTGNNSLQALSVSPGSLNAPFAANDLDYTVDVANNVGSITVTPTLSDPAATMTVNGQPTNSGQGQSVTLGPAGQTTSIPIVVTAQNGNPKTYLIIVSRGVSSNNNLQSLAVSPGALNPSFGVNRTTYTVNVASGVASVSLTPRLQDSAASMTVNGQTNSGQPQTIQLGAAGSSTPIFIIVTAQNGTQKTYTIGVSRAALNGNNNLLRLAVSPGSLNPTFDENLLSYTVDVTSGVTSVSVTPTRQDANATITVNGQATTSGQARTANLNPAGQSTIIPTVVTAQNGSQKTYTITVNRAALGGNNNLSALTVSPSSLEPDFNTNTSVYSVDVGSNVGSVSITPTRQDSNATITVNGQATTSGQARTANLNPAGQSTIIPIVVTAQNGSQKTYTVTVNRAALGGNNNLSALTVSPGNLAPSFNANTLVYSVDVGSNVGSVSITPTRQDSNATITVNGEATTSGQARTANLNPAGQSTIIPIIVTAQNGSPRTYTVTVSRAALGGNNNLSALTVSPGNLSPSFTAARTSYTVNVGSSVDSVTVTATKADSNASMTINNQGTNSGQARPINLGAPGSSTEIDIAVTAPNGDPRIYTITVNRQALGGNNNLSALGVSPGNLSPAFTANRTSYTVSVGSGVNSVTITATKADANAGMTINGQGTNSGQGRSVPLNPAGESTEIDITVTAPNGDPRIYTITVNRAALGGNNNLSALTMSPGSLSPSFNANTTAYAVSVNSNVSSVTVTATLQDTSASMTVDGQGTSSGQARNIDLGAEGSSTDVPIVVTAPNGVQKTYTITINRAALTVPQAPSSAPDLIPQDDSCPRDTATNECLPGTSDADNITNINTPRFRIAQPGAGETPSLYVDGGKVDSTFDQGASTLRPTSGLSDGEHTITSTVTNAGGESLQSPSLTVTIDTVAPGGP